MKNKERVLVAMSGGIDSSIAALLLKDQGYDIVGITVKTGDYSDAAYVRNETLCCNYDSINNARALAVRENFPHYVVDITSEFEIKIIFDFINEYLAGRTPNPCARCNPLIKSDELLKIADRLDCHFIATGHYANIRLESGRYVISKGIDESKDQSYVLWGLKQDNLARTLFPVGKYLKSQIRNIASERGLDDLLTKKESYEICFIPDNDYRGFLNSKVPGLKEKLKGGKFLGEDGNQLGEHLGYPFYTIGQRKGLKVALGEPMYVKCINPLNNTVTLANKESLYSSDMLVRDINSIKYSDIAHCKNVLTRVRYHDKGTASEIIPHNGLIKVVFAEKVFAVTPGQSAVFYENNDLLGGGIII